MNRPLAKLRLPIKIVSFNFKKNKDNETFYIGNDSFQNNLILQEV